MVQVDVRQSRSLSRTIRSARRLNSSLEQFDWISVRIFDLDLSTSGTSLDLVAKLHSGAFQFGNEAGQIGNLHHDPIPAARLLRLTVRHRPRTRSARSTQQAADATHRQQRECGKLLKYWDEMQALRVESFGAHDIFHLVPNAMKALDQDVSLQTAPLVCRSRPPKRATPTGT